MYAVCCMPKYCMNLNEIHSPLALYAVETNQFDSVDENLVNSKYNYLLNQFQSDEKL